jgi:dynein heavy chain
MGPPGGGRNSITPRFTRHFNLISFPPLEDTSLTYVNTYCFILKYHSHIFETILRNFLKQFSNNLVELTSPIVAATVEVYNTIATELLPTPSKSHYTFNLRDLSKVIQGSLFKLIQKS